MSKEKPILGKVAALYAGKDWHKLSLLERDIVYYLEQTGWLLVNNQNNGFVGEQPCNPPRKESGSQADLKMPSAISRRDCFAAMAMQGMLSTDSWNSATDAEIAGAAAAYSETLIKALDKGVMES